MAKNAVARETVFALRQKIAKIEGTLPERLGIACGHSLAAAGAIDATRLRTGCERLDALLGGGLARAALTEIHGAETRDAAAVAGFAMALCGLLLKSAQAQNAPVLWIGTAEMFREAGLPHAAGLHALFGVTPGMLLLCEVPKPADALWVAEEAGALTALAAVVLELRGNPARLDLTATRRLHRRAKAAGRPVFLLRQAAMALPTAAPARLAVSPAPAAPRQTLAGPLIGTIGRPAFSVRVDKCVAALPGLFTLEWNPDEHEFAQGPARKDTAKDAITLVSLPGNGKGAAPAPGQVVAFRPPRHSPLIISRRQGSARRIAALDERAEALGLKRGMGVADAHAMHPAIDFVEADPDADLRLLEELADWCDRYTPLVALDGTQGLFLDITGCATLFGGERAMLEAMLPRFLRQGFYARAGIASTAGAAWAAARFGSDGPVVPGAEADLLAPMPLAALRVEAGIRTRLESVGLRTVGALMAVPRAPLARRFGAELLVRLDQALGHLAEAVSPRLPAAPLSVERQLVEPLVATDDVEELAYMLATSLKPDLERRSEGARALMLALFRVDGTVRRITVATSRPLRDPASIRRLFREKLAATAQGLDAGCGFDLLRLSVISVAPFDIRQTGFDEAEGGQDDDLALFVDRVRARLGERAVLKAVAVESHLPERAVALLPFSQTAPHGPAPARRREVLALPERPNRLLRRPEPIEVPATEMPEGPPLRFHWRRIIHHVAHAEGPERIAPEWWRCEEEGAEAPTRDYYRVEDIEGRRYWLYRQGLHKAGETPPRWFMHGLFP